MVSSSLIVCMLRESYGGVGRKIQKYWSLGDIALSAE